MRNKVQIKMFVNQTIRTLEATVNNALEVLSYNEKVVVHGVRVQDIGDDNLLAIITYEEFNMEDGNE